MRVGLLILATGLSSIVLAAQQSGNAREHDARWSAPATEAAKTNPLATRPDAAEGGKKIFAQRCSTCHGESAEGTSDAPSLTRTGVRRQSDGELFWKISSGNAKLVNELPSVEMLCPARNFQKSPENLCAGE